MNCENGHTVEFGLNFCPVCNSNNFEDNTKDSVAAPAPTGHGLRCANGHECPSAAKFCLECGLPFSTPEETLKPVGQSEIPSIKTFPPLFADQTNSESTTQAKNSNRAVIGIVLSILLGGIGGIFSIVLGRRALSEIDNSGGRLSGRGSAMTSLVLGVISVFGTIVLVIALIATGSTKGQSATKVVSKPSAYSITFGDSLYGTTCANVASNYSTFNSSLPAIIYGPQGQVLATGAMDSGTDMQLPGASGKNVAVCYYSASLSHITSGLGTYVVNDNGGSFSNGITCSESRVESDNCGISRGYSNY